MSEVEKGADAPEILDTYDLGGHLYEVRVGDQVVDVIIADVISEGEDGEHAIMSVVVTPTSHRGEAYLFPKEQWDILEGPFDLRPLALAAARAWARARYIARLVRHATVTGGLS